jgi:hypothetical protein
VTPELEQLVAVLDGLRAGVLEKLSRLSDADGRRSTVASGTNLAGIVQHLTYVESKWFEQNVGGGRPRGKRSMHVDADVSLSQLRAAYREACARSNAIAAGLGDAEVTVTCDGKPRNLRWAMLAVIGETARHAGHADIIREQIDGRTGR